LAFRAFLVSGIAIQVLLWIAVFRIPSA